MRNAWYLKSLMPTFRPGTWRRDLLNNAVIVVRLTGYSVSEGDKDVLLAAARPETTDEESKTDPLEKQDAIDTVEKKDQEVKLLDLSDQELIDVKKSIYEKAYEVFIGSWCETENQLKDFCVLFDTSYDVNA